MPRVVLIDLNYTYKFTTWWKFARTTYGYYFTLKNYPTDFAEVAYITPYYAYPMLLRRYVSKHQSNDLCLRMKAYWGESEMGKTFTDYKMIEVVERHPWYKPCNIVSRFKSRKIV